MFFEGGAGFRITFSAQQSTSSCLTVLVNVNKQ